MTEENFYIGVPNPDETRRYVLESSRAMISTLKRYEEFKKTRMEKTELVMKYNQIMKQINILTNRLKKQFPEAGIRIPTLKTESHAKQKAPQKIEMKEAPQPARAEKKRPMTEVEKLEEELQMIERKLNSIS